MLLLLACLTSPSEYEDLVTRAQDADGDGVTGAEHGGQDCDDQDAGVYPEAPEICDDIDQDCDGEVDEGQEFATWFPDKDGDGFGDDSGAIEACRVLPEHVVTGGDCSDLDASVFPSAAEVCDGVDQNCNDLVDEGLETALWYPDVDGDGYGLDSGEIETCGSPEGYVTEPGDCDDGQTQANPGLEEICADGIDNDCSGDAPECRLLGEYGLSDATVTLKGPSGSGFGYTTAFGDLNGNGTPELIVGAPDGHRPTTGADYVHGAFYVFEDFDGSATNSAHADQVWGSETAFADLGGTLVSGVDWTGDGIADLAVGSGEDAHPSARVVHLFKGDSSGLELSPTASVHQAGARDYFASFVYGGADHNGDGEEELYVLGLGEDEQWEYFVWDGMPEGDVDSSQASQRIHGEGVGPGFVSADVNGDGLADRFIKGDRVFLGDLGPGEGTQDLNGADLNAVIRPDFGVSFALGATAADLNSDGYFDLILSELDYNDAGTDLDTTLVVFDGAADFDQTTSTSQARTRLELDAGYPWHLLTADFDADGVADVVVVDPYSRDETQVYYANGAGGVETEPSATIHTDCGQDASVSPSETSIAWLAVGCENTSEEVNLFRSLGL
jgi:hypothetical protein